MSKSISSNFRTDLVPVMALFVIVLSLIVYAIRLSNDQVTLGTHHPTAGSLFQAYTDSDKINPLNDLPFTRGFRCSPLDSLELDAPRNLWVAETTSGSVVWLDVGTTKPLYRQGTTVPVDGSEYGPHLDEPILLWACAPWHRGGISAFYFNAETPDDTIVLKNGGLFWAYPSNSDTSSQ